MSRDAKRGFERLGRVPPRALGLAPRAARRLELEHAWRIVAGELIAERAKPIAVRRGVLEIRVPDGAWAEGLAPFFPRIAVRLAGRFPGLGVRKFRVVVAGRAGAAPAAAIDPRDPEDDEAPLAPIAPPPEEGERAEPSGPRDAPPEAAADAEGRLASIAERYLRASRAGRRHAPPTGESPPAELSD